MTPMERRDFLRTASTGLGLVAAPALFYDRLMAGTVPASGTGLFQTRFGLGERDLKKVLEAALSKGGDFAEVFLEYRVDNLVTMEEEIIKESSEDVLLGAGIRVLKGDQTGYAYTSRLTPEDLKKTAVTAGAIANGSASMRPAAFKPVKPSRQLYVMDRPLGDEPLTAKIGLVRAAYTAAQA